MQKSRLFLLLFISVCGTACAGPGGGGAGLFHSSAAHKASQLRNPQAVSLSLSDPSLATCVFKTETRIAHFPMWHFPPSGQYNADLREKVAKSQFQLLQTILMYHPDIAVFDERVTVNDFSPKTFRLLKNNGKQSSEYRRADGTYFNLQERFDAARTLFHADIPSHYEHLTEQQKEYLFQTGAPRALYFLGYIPQLHKVIDYEDLVVVENFIKSRGGSGQFFKTDGAASDADRKYYIYDFREKKLFHQVTEFFNINPGFTGMALLSYGANHDFSDDFAGYFFETGSACLAWSNDAPGGPVFSAFASLFPVPAVNNQNRRRARGLRR